jgi:hypothetical protein
MQSTSELNNNSPSKGLEEAVFGWPKQWHERLGCLLC